MPTESPQPPGRKACLSQCLCQETDGSWPCDPWSHIHSTKWRDMTSLLFSGQSTIDYSLLMLPCRWQAGTRGKWKDVISGSPKGKINVIWFVFHPRITFFSGPQATGHSLFFSPSAPPDSRVLSHSPKDREGGDTEQAPGIIQLRFHFLWGIHTLRPQDAQKLPLQVQIRGEEPTKSAKESLV